MDGRCRVSLKEVTAIKTCPISHVLIPPATPTLLCHRRCHASAGNVSSRSRALCIDFEELIPANASLMMYRLVSVPAVVNVVCYVCMWFTRRVRCPSSRQKYLRRPAISRELLQQPCRAISGSVKSYSQPVIAIGPQCINTASPVYKQHCPGCQITQGRKSRNLFKPPCPTRLEDPVPTL